MVEENIAIMGEIRTILRSEHSSKTRLNLVTMKWLKYDNYGTKERANLVIFCRE